MVFFVLRRPSRKQFHPATELYLRYCEGLAKQGFIREKGETPLAYYDRLNNAKPGWGQQMREITERYIELVYKRPNLLDNSDEVKELKGKIRQFHMLMY